MATKAELNAIYILHKYHVIQVTTCLKPSFARLFLFPFIFFFYFSVTPQKPMKYSFNKTFKSFTSAESTNFALMSSKKSFHTISNSVPFFMKFFLVLQKSQTSTGYAVIRFIVVCLTSFY